MLSDAWIVIIIIIRVLMIHGTAINLCQKEISLICKLLFVTRLEWIEKWSEVCVRYIIPILFFKSEREYFWKEKKYFLFPFKCFFRFWDIQVLKFYNLVPRPFLKESSVKRSFRKSVCWFWYILIVLLWHILYNQFDSKI